VVDQWIEVFRMQQDENGVWIFRESTLWEEYGDLFARNQKLTREWNKFGGEYNGVINPRERGRPIAASAAQRTEVLKNRKKGESLRAIVTATALSLRTVRTIVDAAAGKGRTAKRTNEVRRKEFDRLRAAAYRARKAARDRLPKAIDERLKTGAALVKAAKGLGR
jgi:hypothetical protein